MRNIIFWRLCKNIYIAEFVFGLYYYKCDLLFKWSRLWNMLIVIPFTIYILHFNFGVNEFLYKDNFSDISILKLKLKLRFLKWKKRK